MFCPKCGKKSSDDAVFCKFCGAEINKEEEREGIVPVPEAEAVPFVSEPTGEKAPKEHGKLLKVIKSPYLWSGVIVAAVLIALLSAFFTCKRMSDPKYVLNRFCDALVDEDWDTAYSCVVAEDSKLINHDTFSEHMIRTVKHGAGLTAYEISDTQTKPGAMKIKYKVKMLSKGSTEEDFITANLLRQKGKKFFMFNIYNVGIDDLITKNYNITVFEGSSVVLDGAPIDEKYKKKAAAPYYVTYAMPEIFTGVHELKITHPIAKDIDIVFHTEAGDYKDSNIIMKTAARDALFKRAKSDFLEMNRGAENGTSFEKNGIETVTDKADLAMIKSSYARLKNLYKATYNGSKIYDTTYSNITDASDTKATLDKGLVVVNLDYSVLVKMKIFNSSYYYDYYADEFIYKSNTLTDTASLVYVFKNDKWLLKAINTFGYFTE
ncbi:MAG: zinc-ribbon domain-containing protein [Abditibacteriota bacterium]|nr:zinc-ribbon domain-containing protein [Abditibacteriota bacterium]